VAVRIGSNISALQAQRRLSDATSSVTSSLARLSSGQRISRPADDSAGLAISDALRTRSKVFDRGAKNVSDGISLLSIADGALGELAGITSRILELAEQAATGGYSVVQRKALDTEAKSLREEFFRISRSTQFNGINIFDGSIQGLRIQAGFGVDGSVASSLGGKLGTGSFINGSGQAIAAEPIESAIADFTGDGIADVVSGSGLAVFQTGVGDGTFSAGVTLATGGTVRAIEAADFNNDGALDIVAAIGTTSLVLFLNNNAGSFTAATTVTTGGNATAITVGDFNNDGRMDILTGNDNSGADSFSVLLGNGAGGFSSPSTTSLGVGYNPIKLLRANVNSDTLADAVLVGGSLQMNTLRNNGAGGFIVESPTFDAGAMQATGDFNNDGLTDIAITDAGSGFLYLRNSNGTAYESAYIAFSGNALGVGDFNGDGNLDVISGDSDSDNYYTLRGNGKGGFLDSSSIGAGFRSNFTSGDINGDGVLDLLSNGFTPLLGVTRDGVNPILPFSLTTQADARQAIMPLTRKLDELNKQRGVVGGFQARLASAAVSASSLSDGFRSAESRIRDVDVATESARLIGGQIRQQAATAVLAQANIQPRIALQLLGVR
jgi:flagellin